MLPQASDSIRTDGLDLGLDLGLALGLLDTSAAVADPKLAAKLRDLTISWSRFRYDGPILEDADLEGLLARAAAAGHRRILVQSWGHVLREVWTPDGADPATALVRWAAEAGHPVAGGPGCRVVDLDAWRRTGTLAPAVPFPEPLAAASAHLAAEAPEAAARLRAWMGEGIADLDPSEAARLWGEGAARFLAEIRLLAGNLPRGVFVWNLETYDDVAPEEDADGADIAPLASLYSVAAGLKPNWILEAHGFDERTRVVFFDYSEAGLEFRSLLLEEWDGEDYPSFLRRLFRRLPSDRAFYLLWDGATPEDLDWDAVAARWREETERWGGASVLRAHWARYRRLRHELVPCNLLGDPAPLFARMRDESAAAIWWSNAFSTVWGHWHLAGRERRAHYGRFVEGLARHAPRALLYGASADHVGVNGVRAAEYRRWYREAAGDELEPGRLARVALRF